MSRTSRPLAALVALVAVAGLVAACSGGPILARPPAPRPSLPPPTVAPVAVADPQPVELPRDDGPHQRLTEWWYYTGHLRDETGAWFGFEYVVFRAERGDFPVAWASHLAVTDAAGDTFHYAARSEIGPQVDRSPTMGGEPTGFAFALTGADPSRSETLGRPAWTMAGSAGRDSLAASLAPDEAAAAGVPGGLGLDLRLVATKPPALHDGDGWIDFGPAGGSYYYSRTAMTAEGTLTLDGRVLAVAGTAWFDHQWGDFIAVGGGGWDWFAANLEDGTELTISLVRAADGSYPLVYGTLVDVDGTTRHLPADAFSVEVLGEWTSPRTGATYPSGWRIRVPSEGLELELDPVVLDQELDTRATSGVVYWEGTQVVSATRDGQPVGGRAYVELTGYAPSATAGG
jgi:predicted secreted hydrolase